MTQLQAIYSKRETHTIKFFGAKPTKEMTTGLSQAGYIFDGRSEQWYLSEKAERVLSEGEVAQVFKAK